MNNAPVVSVIIPTRNRLALLQRAVDSVNRQQYENIEIIIVDNAAEEPLRAEAINSERPLQIRRSEEMLLLPSSRNFGASFSQADFVSFLDDDDEILPEKIAGHVAALTANEDLAFAYGDTRQVGADGETITVAAGPVDIIRYLRWRYIHSNALTIRNSVFSSMQYNPLMSTYEDVEFNARLLLEHKGVHVPGICAVWYRDNRPDQLTRRNYRRAYENWRRLCEGFEEIIDSAKPLRRFYHRKMLALSLMFADMPQAAKSLQKLL